MNGLLKVFQRISPDSTGDHSNRNGCDRNSMEGESKGQSRESGLDEKTSLYDWFSPKWREKELKPRMEQALKRMEELSRDIG